MWFSRKQVVKSPAAGTQALVPGVARAAAGPQQVTTKGLGDAAEAAARTYLVGQGLTPVDANYRTPGRGGGEIDLIMRARDGTLVFIEVRRRGSDSHGGAGASISPVKQRRIVFAARHYLTRFGSPPPCRFDVVLVQGHSTAGLGGMKIEWLQAAFDAPDAA